MSWQKHCKNPMQAEFIQYYADPAATAVIDGQDVKTIGNGYKAARAAGYNTHTARRQASRLLSKDYIRQALYGFKAVLAQQRQFTREQQQQRLDDIADKAFQAGQYAAAVSAHREINDIAGLHRDTAPNPEREQAKQRLEDQEREALQALARQRSIKLSQGA